VDTSGAGSSRYSDAKYEVDSRNRDAGDGRAVAGKAAPADGATDNAAGRKIRRLIASQLYFGIEAQDFHNGAARTLARLAAPGHDRARVDLRSLGEDFRLDAAASWALLRAMLAEGLLRPDGPGSYQPGRRFREYAHAHVVAPLSRVQARELIDKARKLAVEINADWVRNPFRIKMILVSGSYMSRSDRLPELSLWLVLGRRAETRPPRWRAPPSKSDALRELATTVTALSSFVTVRVVTDKQFVERPFSVVFQADDDFGDPSVPSWGRFREWGASISRRLSLK
jgi:hypothetical protein